MEPAWGLEGFQDLCSSVCRLEILQSLHRSESSSRELEDMTNYEGSTVRRNLKVLMDLGIVERSDSTYRLQDNARFLLAPLMDTLSSFETYGTGPAFWENHDLSPLPEPYKRKFGALKEGNVLEGATSQPRRAIDTYCELVATSSFVKGVSPSVIPEFVETYDDVVQSGTGVELILTRDVRNALERYYGEEFRRALNSDNFKLLLVEDVNFGLTVTDSFITLTLYRTDGTYDVDNYYLAETEEARKWGEDLYTHVKERAEEVSSST